MPTCPQRGPQDFLGGSWCFRIPLLAESILLPPVFVRWLKISTRSLWKTKQHALRSGKTLLPYASRASWVGASDLSPEQYFFLWNIWWALGHLQGAWQESIEAEIFNCNFAKQDLDHIKDMSTFVVCSQATRFQSKTLAISRTPGMLSIVMLHLPDSAVPQQLLLSCC